MASIFMLDTDICSYIMKGAPKELSDALITHGDDTICISVITYAELMFGVLNRQSRKLEKKLEQFLALVHVMDWSDSAARQYAEIRLYLERKGNPIGNMDILIAAAAIAMDAKLVTNNRKHFENIPNLKIADWL